MLIELLLLYIRIRMKVVYIFSCIITCIGIIYTIIYVYSIYFGNIFIYYHIFILSCKIMYIYLYSIFYICFPTMTQLLHLKLNGHFGWRHIYRYTVCCRYIIHIPYIYHKIHFLNFWYFFISDVKYKFYKSLIVYIVTLSYDKFAIDIGTINCNF